MRTLLPTVALGRTGMEITRVGFGAWAIGGEWTFGWGPQDDAKSVATIRHAVANGINWIDTAAVYGLGHSEEVVAAALTGIPRSERPFVFTKCGMTWDGSGTEPARVATPQSIRKEVTDSLRRLNVEQIDLYQLHWPPASGAGVESYWPTFLALKEEGLVRAIGLSNHNSAQLAAAEQIGHVDTLQPPFSMTRREAAAHLLPWCATHDTGAIVYSPMQSGLLSGSFSAERVRALPASDWRASSARFSGTTLTNSLALVEKLRPLAAMHGVAVGVIAIAWTLATRGVTAAIVGARTPEQIDGWLAAASLHLGNEDLATINAAIVETGAGTGPLDPA